MSEYIFKTLPYEHQRKEFEVKRAAPYAGMLGWEMGTGKSKVIIDEAAWLYEEGKIEALLVISKKGSYSVWYREQVPLHLPERVPYVMAHLDLSGGAKNEREVATVLSSTGRLKILVVNVEAFSTESGKAFKLVKCFAEAHRCMCVIDESSSIKNPKARRTKALLKLRGLFTYRRVMTGTPASNGPLNIYTQAEFLKPGLLGHYSWYSFRNEYCTLVDMKVRSPHTGALLSFKKVTGYRNLEKLKADMAPWNSTVRKADCLDLPPKIYETYEVELTDEQRRIYKDMREQSFVQLSTEATVTAQLALTRELRLSQVLCGFVADDEGNLQRIEERRTDALMEVLEELDGSVIIWVRFVPSIEVIYRQIGEEYGPGSAVTYYGATRDRAAAVEAFTSGKARFFIGNRETGGYGLTLVKAHNVVEYSCSYDLELQQQAEDRVHRIGQASAVTYVRLVAPDTVDEKILKALSLKARVQDLLLAPGGFKNII